MVWASWIEGAKETSFASCTKTISFRFEDWLKSTLQIQQDDLAIVLLSPACFNRVPAPPITFSQLSHLSTSIEAYSARDNTKVSPVFHKISLLQCAAVSPRIGGSDRLDFRLALNSLRVSLAQRAPWRPYIRPGRS